MKNRMVSTLPVFALAVTLTACAASPEPAESVPPVETAAPVTSAEATVAVETYLEMAGACLDEGDPDAAIALLEQALAETEDSQLRALLEDLTAPTPLVLEYSNHSGDAVTVHSFTAEETYTHKVRYTLDYSAPEGLTLALSGSVLNHTVPDFHTAASQGQLVFEMDAADIRRMNGVFQVLFCSPEGAEYTLEANTLWPDEIQTAYEISYLMMDHNRTDNALVHSFLLRDDGESCHFTVTYTAREGLTVTGLLETPEEAHSFWEEPFLTEGGDGTLEFDIDKALLADGKYMEVCFTAADGNWVAAGFDFPLRLRRTLAQPQSEPVHPGWLPSSGWGTEYEIHDCYYQRLDNGYVRFTLDITTPGGCFVSVLRIDGRNDQRLDQYLSLPGRQLYVFDIPEDTLAGCRNLSILVAKPNSVGRYFEIPCDAFATASGAAQAADPVDLEYTVTAQPAGLAWEILSGTVQPLDNGSLRYELKIRAEEGMRAILSDPPNGETLSLLFLSAPVDGVHTLRFDMEAAAAAGIAEIMLTGTFSGNQTFSASFINQIPAAAAEPVHVDVLTCD